MPAVDVPPQLVDMVVGAGVHGVLGALGVKHIAGRHRRESRVRRAGDCGQVAVVPAVRVPPQLLHRDVPTNTSGVDDVLGALGVKHIAGRARPAGSTGGGGQIAEMPTAHVTLSFVAGGVGDAVIGMPRLRPLV